MTETKDVSTQDVDATAPDISADSTESGDETESTTTEEQRGQNGAESETEVPLDQVFGILKNARRRRVLQYLEETDGQASLGEVAEQIAAWENDKPVAEITSSERKRVYVGLYQCHLPKMDAMGVVSFNKPRGTIEPGEHRETFHKYLRISEADSDPPWHVYSVALSLGSVAALGSALLTRAVLGVNLVDVAVGAVIVAFLCYAVVCLDWVRSDESDGSAPISF